MIMKENNLSNLMKIPIHLAIIPDGNRRWAKEKNLPTFEGYRRGYQRGIEIGKKARGLGIKYLTFWAFSTENWNRSKEEVTYLMRIFKDLVDQNLKEALKDEIKITHLGRKDRIDQELRDKLAKAEEKTKSFDRYYLNLALDYGGRDEIIRAIKKIQTIDNNSLIFSDDNFNRFLDTHAIPDPDLIIRTSGEMRTSGFMIWQAAYSEWIFYPKYFPDFTSADLEECLKEFARRQRRFGR